MSGSKSNIYKNILIIGFIAVSLLALCIICLYFYFFHTGLSKNHTDWGIAGSFFGGTLGPLFSLLAFLGLLYNIEKNKEQTNLQIEESNKQFKYQITDSNFYSLLELHVNKINQMEFNDAKGCEAFKLLNSKYNLIFRGEIFKYFKRKVLNDPNFIFFLSGDVKEYILKNNKFGIENDIELTQYFIGFEKIYKQKGHSDNQIRFDFLEMLLNVKFDNDSDVFKEEGIRLFIKESFDVKISLMKNVYDCFYENYGYLVGHYCRHVYYILDYISDVDDHEIKHLNIFRAQLSRFELSILYYNALSNYTSDEFNRLLAKFDFFNGLYHLDVCYKPDSIELNSDLDSFYEKYK
ncbi:putative phage abortive infection protein [Providencia huaxiensis]|uniref:putative phage abortive infection protein n=1 Tax=Providencia TaxID=586 RepID=UPI0018E8BF4F|nr:MULTISPECIES: putative phage abortive infection protein [Providencia]QQE95071.1 hypothetical protein JFB93_09755 [Providencia rettgeri]QWJ93538.1 putative phage abortive infection protein [Providencia rettgeri]